jgi:hypothetical protein
MPERNWPSWSTGLRKSALEDMRHSSHGPIVHENVEAASRRILWSGLVSLLPKTVAPFFRFTVAPGGVRGLRPSPTMDRPRASKDNSHTGSPQCPQSGFSLVGAHTPTNFRSGGDPVPPFHVSVAVADVLFLGSCHPSSSARRFLFVVKGLSNIGSRRGFSVSMARQAVVRGRHVLAASP